jgi:tRNA pseudouridine55 synthase
MGGARGDPDRTIHGVLVIDKPRGPTSHDVVARVRRALGTKRAGHAGTLDPMASGVLVVLVGEATKLAPFLTAHDKRYEATVALGTATDTLDAEGTVTAEAEVPAALREDLDRAIEIASARSRANGQASRAMNGDAPDEELAKRAPRIAEALAAERARTEQTPPAYSAIKVGGQKSYDRARAGEAVDLAARPVQVRSICVAPRPLNQPDASAVAGDDPTAPRPAVLLPLEIDVSKGYYVRSLARDLGARLGVPAHLAALRRTQSGPFTIDHAVPLDAGPDALRAAVRPLAGTAAESLGAAQLTEDGAARARHGKSLTSADFSVPPVSDGEPAAWLDPSGRLVAVGRMEKSALVILRGFATNAGEVTIDDS